MAIVDPTAGGNPVKLTKKAALALLENAIVGQGLSAKSAECSSVLRRKNDWERREQREISLAGK